MTRFLIPLYLVAALGLTTACGNKANTSSAKVDSTEIPLAVEQGPGRDDARHLTAEADYAGHHYTFDIYKTPDDSLPQVKDRYGDPYLDNRVKLTIQRDGEMLSTRLFSKADFAGVIDADEGKNLILGGIAFSSVKSDGFQFGAQLNGPGDEEGGLAFLITLPLTGQGVPRIVKDSNQDTSSDDSMD